MPEPTSTATATLVVTGLGAVPILTVAGVSLGLRSDVLLAGFCGAIAAMTLLGSVPGTGDTWRELLKTTLRRVGVAIGSAVFAGYSAPLLSLVNGVPEALLLSVSFLAGAGAMQMLPWLIERFGKGQGVKGGAA
jgi:NaMN:DMB phosphoribosyltransferase